MISNNITEDKAGEEYWTEFWKEHSLPAAIDIDKKGLQNYPYRKLDEFFRKTFNGIETRGKKLLEIGCGNSVYLSYFSKYHHFDVSGIDYSEYGCQCTRQILERDHVTGNIYLGDLFAPPVDLIEKFDVVCSFGVVEHFNETEKAIAAMAKFLKPGGLLITTIPNLTGVTGLLQKNMNKPVYDIHKVMGLDELSGHIRNTGLEISTTQKFLPMSFGVTLKRHDDTPVKFLGLKKYILKCFQLSEKLISLIDDRLISLPEYNLFCAGFLVAARKTGR